MYWSNPLLTLYLTIIAATALQHYRTSQAFEFSEMPSYCLILFPSKKQCFTRDASLLVRVYLMPRFDFATLKWVRFCICLDKFWIGNHLSSNRCYCSSVDAKPCSASTAKRPAIMHHSNFDLLPQKLLLKSISHQHSKENQAYISQRDWPKIINRFKSLTKQIGLKSM